MAESQSPVQNPAQPVRLRSSFSNSSLFRKPRLGDYEIGETIATSKLGKVKLARHVTTKEKVAIKMYRKKLLDYRGTIRAYQEIHALMKLTHPNIVRLLTHYDDKDHISLVMEYVEGGDLFDFLTRMKTKHEIIPIKMTQSIIRQVVYGLRYCHGCDITHRDIKIDNILVTNDLRVKIADFGLSTVIPMTNLLNTCCGSIIYAAPEIISGNPYEGPPVDVWALGVVIYSLTQGFFPFEGDSSMSLHEQILSGKYTRPKRRNMLLDSVIDGCFQLDIKKRITLDELSRHQWFLSENLEEPLKVPSAISIPIVHFRELTVPMIPNPFNPASRIAFGPTIEFYRFRPHRIPSPNEPNYYHESIRDRGQGLGQAMSFRSNSIRPEISMSRSQTTPSLDHAQQTHDATQVEHSRSYQKLDGDQSFLSSSFSMVVQVPRSNTEGTSTSSYTPELLNPPLSAKSNPDDTSHSSYDESSSRSESFRSNESSFQISSHSSNNLQRKFTDSILTAPMTQLSQSFSQLSVNQQPQKQPHQQTQQSQQSHQQTQQQTQQQSHQPHQSQQSQQSHQPHQQTQQQTHQPHQSQQSHQSHQSHQSQQTHLSKQSQQSHQHQQSTLTQIHPSPPHPRNENLSSSSSGSNLLRSLSPPPQSGSASIIGNYQTQPYPSSQSYSPRHKLTSNGQQIAANQKLSFDIARTTSPNPPVPTASSSPQQQQQFQQVAYDFARARNYTPSTQPAEHLVTHTTQPQTLNRSATARMTNPSPMHHRPEGRTDPHQPHGQQYYTIQQPVAPAAYPYSGLSASASIDQGKSAYAYSSNSQSSTLHYPNYRRPGFS